jgi:hypothetical protein
MSHKLFDAKVIAALCFVMAQVGCSSSEFTGGSKEQISYAARNDDDDGDVDKKDGSRNKRGKDSGDGDDSSDELGNFDSGSDSYDDSASGGGGLGEDGDSTNGTEFAFTSHNLCSSDHGTEVVGTNLERSKQKLTVKFFPTNGGETVEVKLDGAKLHQSIVSGTVFNTKLKVPDGTYNVLICAPGQESSCQYVASPTEADENDVEDYFEKYGDKQHALAIAESPVTIANKKVNGSPRLWTLVSEKQDDDPFYCSSDEGTGKNSSPLVVDFSGKGIDLSSPEQGVAFDITGDGWFRQISWPTSPLNAFVALDRNGDGVIDTVHELFGDNTVGPDGQRSANGFLVLQKYDQNRDGFIDAQDEVYSRLRLWTDLNRNGKSDAGELRTLEQAHVKKFALVYDTKLARDRYGNEVRERSFAVMNSGATTPVYDLWFRVGESTESVFEVFLKWIKGLV